MKEVILLVLILLLNSCLEDESGSAKSAEAKKFEKAVAQRVEKEVEVIKTDLKVWQTRMHTIRMVGFIVLTGGAVGSLIWLQRNHSYNPGQEPERQLQIARPRWWDHYAPRAGRILELQPQAPQLPQAPPAPRAARTEADTPPRRRRASGNRNRNRNHHHDETPRHR